MKKTQLSLMVVFAITILTVSGCLSLLGGPTVTTALGSGSNQTEFSFALANPHNFLVYPAVGAAFTSIKGSLGGTGELQPSLSTINVLGNEFMIRTCHASRSSTEVISYQIKIGYKENQLTVEFIDIEPYKEGILIYTDAQIRAMRFDAQKTANQIKTEVEKVLASDASYKTAKQAFLANNDFLNRSLVPVTRMMEDEFVQTVFKDGEVTFSARISNVQKNEAAEFRNFTTLVTATLRASTSSTFFVTINFYTSDPEFARLTQNQQVQLTGNFIRMEPVAGGIRRFFMTK